MRKGEFMKVGNEATRINVRFILAAVAIFGLIAGCASTSTVHEMNAMQQNISMLHERVQALEKRTDGMDGQSQKRADLYSRLEELQVKVGALNGRIEDTDHKLEQLARTAATPPPPPAAPPSPATPTITNLPPAATLAPPPTSATTPPPTSAATAPPASTPTPPPVAKTTPAPQPNIAIPEKEKEDPEKALLDKATQSFQKGQFESARKDYQSLVSKYPKSQQADDALYSVGECYFSEKRYQDAVEAYQQVIERYPKGNRVPQALFKQGAAFQQMGDTTAARILYERLVEKYPDSSQAQAAQKKLKQLQ